MSDELAGIFSAPQPKRPTLPQPIEFRRPRHSVTCVKCGTVSMFRTRKAAVEVEVSHALTKGHKTSVKEVHYAGVA